MNKIPIRFSYLGIIIVLAAVLRFYKISSLPPSLNWDEVSHGYNAYSILKTGKDEWGVMLPTIFQAFGDYKLPMYIYTSVIPIALFGMNAFAIRFVSAFAGVLTVYFSYKLATELFSNHKDKETISLVSAFLVAVEPWSLFLSRGAFEANLSLTFIISGFYFLLSGLHKQKNLIYASILLSLSVWTYNSARVFIPIMLFCFSFLYHRALTDIWKSGKSYLVISIFIICLSLSAMAIQLTSPQGQARFSWVSVFDQGLVNDIENARNTTNFSPIVSRIIYNKATFGAVTIAQNWISHYLPDYLFIRGGTHHQFSVPDHGVMYVINILFFYTGLIITFLGLRDKENRNTYGFLLAWMVVGSLASSITREAPHVLRSITLLPIPMIITAIGVNSTVTMFKKKVRIVLSIYLIVVLVFTLLFFIEYRQNYRSKYSWSWQFGNEQMVDYLKQNYDKYAKIIITKKYGEPHEFILFYWPWDPNTYQTDESKIRYHQSDWYWVDKFDKFYFVNDWEVVGTPENPKSPTRFVLESRSEDVHCSQIKCLLVTSPSNVPDRWEKLESINFLDGTTAYEIYEN